MSFQWDERKNAANNRKHGVPFSVAEAFFWDEAEFEDDLDHEGEDRHRAYGYATDGFGYMIVFTFPGDDIRIISARRFTKREYEQHG